MQLLVCLYVTNVSPRQLLTPSTTAAVDIIALVLTYVPTRTTYYQAAVVILGKLYSNSLLVILNMRMRTHSPTGATFSTGLTSVLSDTETNDRISQVFNPQDRRKSPSMEFAKHPRSTGMSPTSAEGEYDKSVIVQEEHHDNINRIFSSISSVSF